MDMEQWCIDLAAILGQKVLTFETGVFDQASTPIKIRWREGQKPYLISNSDSIASLPLERSQAIALRFLSKYYNLSIVDLVPAKVS